MRDPDSRVLVVDAAGDLVGLCIVRMLSRPDLFQETRRGEIEALIVRPGVRRRGHGRALARAAARWLADQGAERVEIQVTRGNAEGQALWRALGFAPAMDVLELRL